MSETARIIAGMAVLVVALGVVIAGLAGIYNAFAPEVLQQAITNLVNYASEYIIIGRGLVNQLVLPGAEWVIDAFLQIKIFSWFTLKMLKLTYRVSEYFVKGY